MVGLDSPAGIDGVATMSYIDSKKTSPYEAGTLKGIISGSLRLQQRLFVAGFVASAAGPFCNLEDETLENCFWKCPKWHLLRTQRNIPTLEVCNSCPACTRERGIVVEHEEILALKAELENEEHDASHMIEALWTMFGSKLPLCRSMMVSCFGPTALAQTTKITGSGERGVGSFTIVLTHYTYHVSSW